MLLAINVLSQAFACWSVPPLASSVVTAEILSMSSWKEIADKKKKEQIDRIPKEWLISVDSELKDVRSVPHECGLLSARELEITELDNVEILLHKLAEGEWSSVEVTTAFYKRAIIAHQLVREKQ